MIFQAKGLVKDKVSRAGGDGNGTTVRAGASVNTIFIRAGTIDGGAVSSHNLDVEIWGILVVWVWNNGQVSDTISVTSAQDNWGPVTDTGAFSTPNTPIFHRDTGVVDVVLGRSLLTLPLIVRVLLDDVDWLGGTSANNSRNDHIFGTWIVRTTNSNRARNLVDNLGRTLTFLTQPAGVGVGTVQLAVLTVQTTNGSTIRRLLRRPLSFGVAWRTSIRTVVSILTGGGCVTVHVHDGSPAAQT